MPDPSFEVVSYKILLSPCRCPNSASGCISGTVANSAGEPIAGKTVVLKKRGPFGWKKIKTAVTERDGCYRFTDLKDGRYRVRVRDCEGGGGKIVVINSGAKVGDVNFECQ